MTPDLLADMNITAARAGLLLPLEREGKRQRAGMDSCERNLDLWVRGWETEATNNAVVFLSPRGPQRSCNLLVFSQQQRLLRKLMVMMEMLGWWWHAWLSRILADMQAAGPKLFRCTGHAAAQVAAPTTLHQIH